LRFISQRAPLPLGTTPAIAAGLTPVAMTMAEIVDMIDAREGELLANKRSAMQTDACCNLLCQKQDREAERERGCHERQMNKTNRL
jgi:hypothetical protein